MKNSFKNVLFAIYALVFAFSSINIFITNANAETASIKIADAQVSELSGNAISESFNYSDSTITSNVIFHSKNDSITYKLSFLNEDVSDYNLTKVVADSKDEYLSISNTTGAIESGKTKYYNLTITYNDLINDIANRTHNTTIKITFIFEKIEKPAKNAENPKTNDSIIFYIIAMTASALGLGILIATNRHKTSLKAVFIGAIIACASLSVNSFAAQSTRVELNINANYDLASKLTVTYNVDDQTSSIVADYGKYAELPTPEKAGFSFTAWLDEENREFNDIITRDIELTASFTKNTYTISYDYATNGGTGATTENLQLEYGDDIDLTPVATKPGWTFLGWNTNKNSHEAISELSLDNASDLTVYAIYKKQITAFFDGNGRNLWTPLPGSLPLLNFGATTRTCWLYNMEPNCEITTPGIATLEPWKKLGWSASANDHDNILFREDETITISGNSRYYAQTYAPEITYTASWDANGNTLSIDNDSNCTIPIAYNRETQATSCTVDTPNIQAPAGYEIIGFNTESTASSASSDYDNGKLTLTSENTGKTWYALSTSRIIKVAYDSNDGWFGNNRDADTNVVEYYNGSIINGNYIEPSYTAKSFDKWWTSQGQEFNLSSYSGPLEITVYASYNNERAALNLRSINRFTHDRSENGTRAKYLITAVKRENSYPSWAEGKDWSTNIGRNIGTDGNESWVTGTKPTDNYKLPIIVWYTSNDYVLHWYSEDPRPYAVYSSEGGTQIGFSDYTALEDISGIKDWDVSGIDQMEKFFYNCRKLKDLSPVEDWDVSNVLNMKQAFAYMTELEDASALNNWNITKVTEFTEMFRNTTARPSFSKRPGSWQNNGTYIPQE